MKVTCHGVLSNGQGLYDFVRFDLIKMMNLFDDELSFYLINFFIINVIEKSINQNRISNWICVKLEVLQDLCLPNLTHKQFIRSLKKLQKMQMIKYQKARGKDNWEIQILS